MEIAVTLLALSVLFSTSALLFTLLLLPGRLAQVQEDRAGELAESGEDDGPSEDEQLDPKVEARLTELTIDLVSPVIEELRTTMREQATLIANAAAIIESRAPAEPLSTKPASENAAPPSTTRKPDAPSASRARLSPPRSIAPPASVPFSPPEPAMTAADLGTRPSTKRPPPHRPPVRIEPLAPSPTKPANNRGEPDDEEEEKTQVLVRNVEVTRPSIPIPITPERPSSVTVVSIHGETPTPCDEEK